MVYVVTTYDQVLQSGELPHTGRHSLQADLRHVERLGSHPTLVPAPSLLLLGLFLGLEQRLGSMVGK